MCTEPKKQASVKCTLTFYPESLISKAHAVVLEAITCNTTFMMIGIENENR